MRLILGSESPFRKQLLEDAGYEFITLPANIDEKAIRDDDPEELVTKLGLAKMDAVIEKLGNDTADTVVITSDQVVVRVIDREILEKPLDFSGQPDKTAAALMLMSYANSPVQTVTSLVVKNLQLPAPMVRVDHCTIYLSRFSDDEIKQMVQDPRIYQACGALPYGVPNSIAADIIGQHITKMDGDESSFIGLPIPLLFTLLAAVGYIKFD